MSDDAQRPRKHATIISDVSRTNDRIRRATATLNELLDRRRDLYVEARDREDPVPFKQLAEAAGTTEAAVMQVVKKGRAANDHAAAAAG